MKKRVWNKKAQEEPMLGRAVIEILIAIVVVGFIIYAVIVLFRTYFGRQDELQAKGQLERIIQALSEADEPGENEKVLLQTPLGWHVVAFDAQHNENEGFEKPNALFQKYCICICKKRCKTEICRTIAMPLKQDGKVAEQAFIEIEIKELWFKNMQDYWNVTEKEPITKAELSEEEKEEFAIGRTEIEKNYKTVIEKIAQEQFAEVEAHFVNAEDFENFIEALIWIESRNKADAISICGAVGLMQLMPDTARGQGLVVPEYKEICNKDKGSPCSGEYKDCAYAFECNSITTQNCKKDEDERYNAEKNIEAGTVFLVGLIKQFNDKQLALAAYNAGPGRVQKICKDTIYSCPVTFKGREYAETVMAYYLEMA